MFIFQAHNQLKSLGGSTSNLDILHNILNINNYSIEMSEAKRLMQNPSWNKLSKEFFLDPNRQLPKSLLDELQASPRLASAPNWKMILLKTKIDTNVQESVAKMETLLAKTYGEDKISELVSFFALFQSDPYNKSAILPSPNMSSLLLSKESNPDLSAIHDYVFNLLEEKGVGDIISSMGLNYSQTKELMRILARSTAVLIFCTKPEVNENTFAEINNNLQYAVRYHFSKAPVLGKQDMPKKEIGAISLFDFSKLSQEEKKAMLEKTEGKQSQHLTSILDQVTRELQGVYRIYQNYLRLRSSGLEKVSFIASRGVRPSEVHRIIGGKIVKNISDNQDFAADFSKEKEDEKERQKQGKGKKRDPNDELAFKVGEGDHKYT